MNILRGFVTEISNMFGKKGYERSIYNYAINSLMKKVKEEMKTKKIDKICNSNIILEFPGMYNSRISEVIVEFTGTALRKKIRDDDDDNDDEYEEPEESEK
jgi:hypothetical protein